MCGIQPSTKNDNLETKFNDRNQVDDDGLGGGFLSLNLSFSANTFSNIGVYNLFQDNEEQAWLDKIDRRFNWFKKNLIEFEVVSCSNDFFLF